MISDHPNDVFIVALPVWENTGTLTAGIQTSTNSTFIIPNRFSLWAQ